MLKIESLTNFLNNYITCDFVESIHGYSLDQYIYKLLDIPTTLQLKKTMDALTIATGSKCTYELSSAMQITITTATNKRFYPSFYAHATKLKNHGDMLIGIDDFKNDVIYNIQDTKSILVAGSSGSGKSVCISNLIMSLACFERKPYKVKLNLIDLKKVEFEVFKNLAILNNHVANDYNDAITILRKVKSEIEKRYKMMQKKGIRKATTNDFDINITIIDEYQVLTSINQNEVDNLVGYIASVGRACNCYIIVSTQYPTNKTISNLIRSNIQSRICLRTTNTTQSVVILGCSKGVELLGKGDCYFQTEGEKLKRLQVCYINENEIKKSICSNDSNDSKNKKKERTKKRLWNLF